MGVMYYLIDHERRSLFELGKGYCWGDMVDQAGAVPPSDQLRTLLAQSYEEPYLTNTVDRITAFAAGRKIELTSDSFDEYGELHYGHAAYKIVGSRYDGFDAEDTEARAAVYRAQRARMKF